MDCERGDDFDKFDPLSGYVIQSEHERGFVLLKLSCHSYCSFLVYRRTAEETDTQPYHCYQPGNIASSQLHPAGSYRMKAA